MKKNKDKQGKVKKGKLLILAPAAAAMIVVADATRSDAFILKTLKGLWNQTTEIVTQTFDHYVGQYVFDLAAHYVPKGIEAVAGALGLPDPGGMFEDIQTESAQNKTDNNDIAAGDIKEGEVAAGTTDSMGQAVLSEKGQKAGKQVSDVSSQISKSTSEVAEKCQESDISQEVMKCLTIQNANNAKLSQVQISQQQQILQQLAAGNIANAKQLEQANQDAREKQAKIDQAAKDTLLETDVFNAVADGLGKQK